jgi:hypothetical protein
MQPSNHNQEENIMDWHQINVGDTLTYSVTGKKFIAEMDGCSFNYARSSSGAITSNEGATAEILNILFERSCKVSLYISSDNKRLTDWKGNTVGLITHANQYRLSRMSYTHGSKIYAYVIRDIFGGFWYGRGNPGLCITIRPYKK